MVYQPVPHLHELFFVRMLGRYWLYMHHIYRDYVVLIIFGMDIPADIDFTSDDVSARTTFTSIIFCMNFSADTDSTGMLLVGLYHIYIRYFFAGIFGRYWFYRYDIHQPEPHLHQLYLV